MAFTEWEGATRLRGSTPAAGNRTTDTRTLLGYGGHGKSTKSIWRSQAFSLADVVAAGEMLMGGARAYTRRPEGPARPGLTLYAVFVRSQAGHPDRISCFPSGNDAQVPALQLANGGPLQIDRVRADGESEFSFPSGPPYGRGASPDMVMLAPRNTQ